MTPLTQRLLNITALLLCFQVGLMAGNSAANGLSFLKVDVDSRSAAMAGAYSALAQDAAAAYWNPAGLALAGDKNLVLTHNSWIADISQDFAAVQFFAGKHNLALSANLMNIPGIEIRGDRPSDQPDGKTEVINFAASLSYARKFKSGWRAGLSLKYLYEKYYLEMAPGWAADIGVQRSDLLAGLDWGITLFNYGRMTQLKETRSPLPFGLRTGLAWKPSISFWHVQALVAGDIEYIRDEDILVRLGTDLNIRRMLHLRLGIIQGSGISRLTTGFGLAFKDYHLDYAFVPFDYEIGNSHRFSLGFFF